MRLDPKSDSTDNFPASPANSVGGLHKDERIIVMAPIGQDATAMAALLEAEGFTSQICDGMEECCYHVAAGIGVLLLTEEALEFEKTSYLLDALKVQPAWSEIPLIILTTGGESRLSRLLDVAAVAAGTVILLERPVTRRTLLRAVEVALQSRRRQYQARDLLSELQFVNQTLEERVVARTAEAVERAESLRLLSMELSAAEERERRRIAHILHDDLQQLLVAARMQFALLCRSMAVTQTDPIVEQIAEVLDRSFNLTRSLSVELAPPVLDDEGLAAALEWLIEQTKKYHSAEITLEAEVAAAPANADLRVFLFRSVRELLLNSVKHAPDSPVQIQLTRVGRNKIKVIVADEGPGFEADRLNSKQNRPAGLGLSTISQRISTFGGEVHIDTAPGRGTRVTLTVPCDLTQKASAPLRRSGKRASSKTG